MDWDLPITLDGTPDGPLFVRVASAISREVRSGRLARGQRLPGSRRLSQALGIHRNTVLAAFEELAAEGWITTRPGGGTYVSAEPPSPWAEPRHRPVPARSPALGFDLAPLPLGEVEPVPAGGKSLGAGTPDVRQVPMAALAAAYRRVLKLKGRALLDHGDPRGHPRLREALAEMASKTRGLSVGPEDLLVTRGSQMALYLVGRALLSPGDCVAVEELGYRAAWDAFCLSGAQLVPIPVDRDGLQVDALAEVVRRRPLRAVYVTPHTQYPTTAPLSEQRRGQLLALARANRFAIIEDDYDHDFHYQGPLNLPLARADGAGVVVYLGSLSKLLAPGLRLGFVVAPRQLLGGLAGLRFRIDRQGDQVLECAVAELLEDGEVQRHALRMRSLYRSRRDAMVSALRTHLGGAVRFDVPQGGVAIWARVDPARDLEAWVSGARALGLVMHPARQFAFDGRRRPAIRLGFAALTPQEIDRAITGLSEALPKPSHRTPRGRSKGR